MNIGEAIAMLGTALILCAFAFALFSAGYDYADERWQQRLIAAKLAHWAVDPVTGETEFVLHEALTPPHDPHARPCAGDAPCAPLPSPPPEPPLRG